MLRTSAITTVDTRVAKPPDDLERPGARQRGYDAAWEKAAADFKHAHPYCLGCAAIGVRTRTEVVDHIIPHKGDRARFWDRKNWQPGCKRCHDGVKATLEGLFERGTISVAALQLNSATAVSLSLRARALRSET
jgi:5-methylcytosine-specific restriction protein A